LTTGHENNANKKLIYRRYSARRPHKPHRPTAKTIDSLGYILSTTVLAGCA